MSRRLIVRSEAEADLTEAALWYEGREFVQSKKPIKAIRPWRIGARWSRNRYTGQSWVLEFVAAAWWVT